MFVWVYCAAMRSDAVTFSENRTEGRQGGLLICSAIAHIGIMSVSLYCVVQGFSLRAETAAISRSILVRCSSIVAWLVGHRP